MKRKLRFGMIGGGPGAFIGAVHRVAATMDGQAELVAGAFSSHPGRSRAMGAELFLDPARVYRSFTEMARAEARQPAERRLDFVVIVTPNDVHFPAARACLAAGFNVVLDKPATFNLREARRLRALVRRSRKVLVLTHNYTGNVMVKEARALVRRGALGTLRKVVVEYPQGWLSTALERTGQKQAVWRTDPRRSGAAGCLGDIGTHAYHLAGFVTGLSCEAVAADLGRFVTGRRVDDNVNLLLRYAGGARGMLWASQVAPGNDNDLRLRVYGERAGLEWRQEEPNQLRFAPLGEPPRIIRRGSAGADAVAAHATRIPAGHPEGYLEAFAQLYTDLAEQITAHREHRAADPASLLVPGIAAGVDGMRFIAAALESAQRDAGWVALAGS